MSSLGYADPGCASTPFELFPYANSTIRYLVPMRLENNEVLVEQLSNGTPFPFVVRDIT
jgi:hypothetical protein